MAIREITKIGEEVLRKRCHPVNAFDKKLHLLLRDMAETMYAADGVGLAAPQVGILRRIVVIDVGDGLIELINPVILETRGAEVGPEGCLSVPGRQGKVERPTWVKVLAQDRKGRAIELEGDGLLARCVCHELDHLDGVLYCDKMIEEITENNTEENTEEQENGEA